MQSISPVYTEELVECEQVIALDQPEYNPLISLRIAEFGNVCLTRWEFSPEEREIIANGGNILIGEMLFGGPFTPICFEVLPKDAKPTIIDIELIHPPDEEGREYEN